MATKKIIQNTSAITFPSPSGTWGTITHAFSIGAVTVVCNTCRTANEEHREKCLHCGEKLSTQRRTIDER